MKYNLKKVEEDLLPEVKFWSQNRTFLVWGIMIALLMTSSIELFKLIFGEESLFYFYFILMLTIFSLIIGGLLTKKIDATANDKNKIYNIIRNERIKMEKEK